MAKQLVRVPLLKPDEATITAAVDAGKRIGILATIPRRVRGAKVQLRPAAAAQRRTIEVVQSLAGGAFGIGNAGDVATHDRIVVEAAERIADQLDVLCLAQVSMALARAAVQARGKVPVLTSPAAAAVPAQGAPR